MVPSPLNSKIVAAGMGADPGRLPGDSANSSEPAKHPPDSEWGEGAAVTRHEQVTIGNAGAPLLDPVLEQPTRFWIEPHAPALVAILYVLPRDGHVAGAEV